MGRRGVVPPFGIRICPILRFGRCHALDPSIGSTCDRQSFERSSCAVFHRSADGRNHFLGVVDSQSMQDGRVQICNFDGIFWLVGFSVRIGFSYQKSGGKATATQEARESGWPVVASPQGIDIWRSAELARDEHNRRLKQVAVGQVFE